MFVCPNCGVRLEMVKSEHGRSYVCPDCGGKTEGLGVLRDKHGDDVIDRFWEKMHTGESRPGCDCPACENTMDEVVAEIDGFHLALDVCSSCHLLWMDPDEDNVLRERPQELPASQLPPEGITDLERDMAEEAEDYARSKQPTGYGGGSPPRKAWKYLPALLGMPVEANPPALRRKPYFTWGMSGLLILCFLITVPSLRRAIETFGLIPTQLFRYGGLTLLSAFFLHAGIMHLASNVYFLWVFGDNVESALGPRDFLWLLLTATLFSHLLYFFIEPFSRIPSVGASGGISGIIVFYALRYPDARLRYAFWIYFYPYWLTFSATTGVILWAAFQVLGAYLQIAGFSAVNAVAHLGGAGAGIGFWYFFYDG